MMEEIRKEINIALRDQSTKLGDLTEFVGLFELSYQRQKSEKEKFEIDRSRNDLRYVLDAIRATNFAIDILNKQMGSIISSMNNLT
jgi:hypothetical protein